MVSLLLTLLRKKQGTWTSLGKREHVQLANSSLERRIRTGLWRKIGETVFLDPDLVLQ